MQLQNNSLPIAAPVQGPLRRLRGPAIVVLLIVLVIVAALGVGLTTMLTLRRYYRFYTIPAEGMEPTLMGHDQFSPSTGERHSDAIHDLIRCDLRAYRSQGPRFGDIIVFTAPGEADAEDKAQGRPQVENTLVKRVIGLPGDTIEIKNGRVYRNGQKLEEYHNPPGNAAYSIKEPMLEALEPQFRFGTAMAGGPVHLGGDQLWVMGDNRNNSNDSRYWGALDRHRVIGKVVAIVAPPERARTFP